jgi:hypothetical protein
MLTLVRRRTLFLLAGILALASGAAPANAQYPGDRRGYPESERRHVASHADSLRSLRGAWQLWGHAGPGWLSAPGDVRKRYAAGLEFGASGDRRLADRFALRAHLDFKDLPSTQPDAVIINGIAYATNVDYGHGWLLSSTAGLAVRPWNHLWVEGGAGGARFESGFSGTTAQDLVTGTRYAIPAATGWGGVWGAGMRYEFKPNLRDRFLGEVQYLEMQRGDTRLRFMAVRVGYRAF